ncbi:hypothetical protein [Streptomyces sp. NPDC054842]
MTKRLLCLVLITLALTVSCTPDYPAGASGRVTDRSRAYFKSGGWRYTLTTTGDAFRVTRSDYKHCVTGSQYPDCTEK